MTALMRSNLTVPALLATCARCLRRSRLRHAADVEGAHGELRARLADRLGGDDADRHAFLDQVAGGQVHAVAQPAEPSGRLAGHRAADEDLVDAQFSILRAWSQVIISFSRTMTSPVIGW